jgi:hypothetical protein
LKGWNIWRRRWGELFRQRSRIGQANLFLWAEVIPRRLNILGQPVALDERGPKRGQSFDPLGRPGVKAACREIRRRRLPILEGVANLAQVADHSDDGPLLLDQVAVFLQIIGVVGVHAGILADCSEFRKMAAAGRAE